MLRMALARAARPCAVSAAAAARGLATGKMLPPLSLALVGTASVLGSQFAGAIASGQVFGADQPLAVKLVDADARKIEKDLTVNTKFVPSTNVFVAADVAKAVDGANFVVAATAGGDLAAEADTFATLGKAIGKGTAGDCRVLVVGEKAHTLAMVLAANMAAPHHPDLVMALSHGELSTAVTSLAQKLGAKEADVDRVALWGGNGALAFADASHARVAKKWAMAKDAAALQGSYSSSVSAACAQLYGKSGSPAIAKSASDFLRSFWQGNPTEWFSLGVTADSYGIDSDLWFSVPVVCDGLVFKRVYGLPIDPFAADMMNKSIEALKKERELVRKYLPVSVSTADTGMDFAMKDIPSLASA